MYALITDQKFREEAVATVGGTDVEVTIEPSGDGHTVTVIQTQPAKMPDFIKKFVGDSVSVKQTERWSGATATAPEPLTSGSGHRPAGRHERTSESSPATATSPSSSRAT